MNIFLRIARLCAIVLILVPAFVRASTASSTAAAGGSSLTQLSLEQLMQLEISTVSRKTEPWWAAPGAIDVVTGDDLRRSGAQTLPDALRLATGMHVGQPNAREWAIGIRGFNVLSSNKINVQLDGRSLFTPFFSGVLWDAQDTLLEDIDRIEVLRGPGGALWGAFAVNGFVQILTKPAWETQGWLASAGTGSETPFFFSVRHGGKAGRATFYRVYAKYHQFEWSRDAAGHRTLPVADFAQAGFRSDTRAGDDTSFTLQGDAYTNKGTPKDRVQTEISGANVLGRFIHVLSLDADLEATGYYDYTSRLYPTPFHEERHTLSASVKHRLQHGRHALQFGADTLVSWDDIASPSAATIEPGSRTFSSTSVFAQDVIALVPQRWSATVGAKLERNTFSGFDLQPTVRLAWTPSFATTWWAAVSRAVRPPVRLDADLVSRIGSTLLFEGNDDLDSEKVVAYELGLRRRVAENLAIDLAGFVNRYDDVRSYESRGATQFPWTFKNTLNAETHGFEATVLYQPVSRWLVKAGYRYLDFELTKDPGSGDFLNGLYEGNDPRHVLTMTVHGDVARDFEIDLTLRHASRLPQPALPGYTTADVRLGWHPRPEWEFALIGRNLLDSQHREFTTPNSLDEELARSVALKATWRY